jgi:hypothetical protein
MNYEQSNVGLGMVPCRKGCRCDECTIERLTAEIRQTEELHAAILALEGSEGMTDAKFVQWVLAALKSATTSQDAAIASRIAQGQRDRKPR